MRHALIDEVVDPGECSRRVAFNHAELVENKMSGQVAAGVGKSFLVTR